MKIKKAIYDDEISLVKNLILTPDFFFFLKKEGLDDGTLGGKIPILKCT